MTFTGCDNSNMLLKTKVFMTSFETILTNATVNSAIRRTTKVFACYFSDKLSSENK